MKKKKKKRKNVQVKKWVDLFPASLSLYPPYIRRIIELILATSSYRTNERITKYVHGSGYEEKFSKGKILSVSWQLKKLFDGSSIIVQWNYDSMEKC